MPLNRQEYLITKLMEEAVEVAHRCAKALTFGLHDHPPGSLQTAEHLLMYELVDFQAVFDKLVAEEILKPPHDDVLREMHTAKDAKIEKYYDYSVSTGAALPR